VSATNPPLRRRASDVPKPPCPWCGSDVSSVYRSKTGLLASDFYRRRRQCAECRRDWPTVEGLDVALFQRELATCGLTLEGLGIDARPDSDNGGEPMGPLPPHTSTWEHAFHLLHELWGDAQVARPYDRAAKKRWAALLTCLEREATRAGYSLAPR